MFDFNTVSKRELLATLRRLNAGYRLLSKRKNQEAFQYMIERNRYILPFINAAAFRSDVNGAFTYQIRDLTNNIDSDRLLIKLDNDSISYLIKDVLEEINGSELVKLMCFLNTVNRFHVVIDGEEVVVNELNPSPDHIESIIRSAIKNCKTTYEANLVGKAINIFTFDINHRKEDVISLLAVVKENEVYKGRVKLEDALGLIKADNGFISKGYMISSLYKTGVEKQ